ncbi:AAA-like domain protein [Candidatus Desulfarcum epimagneticum]|uniref:AAA-like domain protein n=1 Tax=uncultured Desulfobacteraceae bacterium TaxID=218296 RepID=A0A484HFY7_9BACT|nr:AAA-like domain protein [uncultured Desulfobacteraceae bacterium]
MHFFALSVRNHIVDLVNKLRNTKTQSRKMILMVPAMPEKTLLKISEAITSRFLAESDVSLTLKIAKVLSDDWSPFSRSMAKEKGWLDERENLTYYRSNVNVEPGKFSLIVLCGADRVTDAASLSDFHSCDPQMIWETKMKSSFEKWIGPKLKSIGIHDISPKDMEKFDRILISLEKAGRADILQISDWLEKLDLNNATNISQALKIMLANFQEFDLPVFSMFPVHLKRQLTPYINRATEFFNYTLFLDPKRRKKALKSVDAVLTAIGAGESTGIVLDEDVIGSYPSDVAFLLGLKKFIETDDPEECSKLKSCDFVVLSDKILKFKRPAESPSERKLGRRKLSGSPFECVLTAVWNTLKDFHSDKQFDPDGIIGQIRIETDQFKHDIESDDNSSGDSAEERANLAREYLTRLIGGIDDILQKQVALTHEDELKIVFSSHLVTPEVNCAYSKTAEPALEFSVYIEKQGSDSKPFRRKFAWRLPEHHMYRLSAELILRVKRVMETHNALHKLPVFYIAYYDELLRASSEEEIRRVLLHSIRDESSQDAVFTNLLNAQWLQVDDPILSKLKRLAKAYEDFICHAGKKGLFSAIFASSSKWADLRIAYQTIFDAIHQNHSYLESSLIGMLVRSFLVIQPRSKAYGDSWHADSYEQSGVATVLHPAVIELLEAQLVFQSRCFNYAANKELKNPEPKKAFKPYAWRTFLDLSTIQTPLSGLLKDAADNLDTNVRGLELIHRIGKPEASEAPLSTRILMPYQDVFDDNGMLNDSEIFQETSESRLLLRLMQDYFDLHPHARDGLSLAVFRNKDIQPVISAVHEYLKDLSNPNTSTKVNKRYVLTPDRQRPYAISVTLFTESNDDTDVAGWIDQWKERWEAAETEKKYQLYRQCRFSIAHRVVERDSGQALQRLVNEQFQTDIAVLYDFIRVGSGAGVDTFENVAEFDVTSRELKFPILEKACCMINDPGKAFKRSRVISNRQFVLGSSHANLLHGLKAKSVQEGTLVIGTGDFSPWRSVIDSLHKKAEWVICVDPNMDERLIKLPASDSSKEREIIGFGSGVGTHGGDNYTVSTEQFSLSDIDSRLSASIRQLYGKKAGWNQDNCNEISKGILSIAKDLSGLSLVRATGAADQYIRDFLAYSLSRKLLKNEKSVLCESLISLDAYRHWFDLAEDSKRPDLLWIQASIKNDDRFHLNMHLIECKLSNESPEHVSKAMLQIENGLKVLISAFTPIESDDSESIEDDRPDRRYWWMQLHRLIACKAIISKSQHSKVLTALERLSEGDYDIAWNASVFTFWINNNPNIQRTGYWLTGEDVRANIYSIGGGFVYKLATGDKDQKVDWAVMESQGEPMDGTVNLSDSSDDDDDGFWEMDDIDDEKLDDAVLELQPIDLLMEIDNDNLEKGNDLNTDKDSNGIEEVDLDGSKTTIEETALAIEHWDRIFLGNTLTGNQPVYWEFGHKDLANRHMLIFGSSGQGKTYAIQCILCEMGKFRQKSLIIDYTNGFLPDQLEPETNDIVAPEQHVVSNNPLPINPFLPQVSDHGGIIIKQNANDVAKRIAGLFNAVYNIGDQQYSVLHRAIMDGVESLREQMNLEQMLAVIEEMTKDKKFKSSAQTLYNKLRPFVLDKPFSHGEKEFDWTSIFQDQDPLCNIFQLAGKDGYSQKLITEFILWDLYGFLQSKGKKSEPKVIVLDEVQNLDHQEDSPLSKYLREGRKFGLSLILATQTMSNMKKDEQDRMFNAEHKLFFRPADTELKSFANIAALFTDQSPNDWIGRLSSLKKGECFSIGQGFNTTSNQLVQKVSKIKISALGERGFNE